MKGFEQAAGLVQILSYGPLAVGALAVAGAVALGFGVMGDVGEGALTGPSLDIEGWLFDPDLAMDLEALEPNDVVPLLLSGVPPWWLYASVWVQNLALLLLALLLAALTVGARRRWADGDDSWSAGLASAFGLRRVDARWIGLGAAGGLTVSWLPGLLLELLDSRLGLDNTTTEIIASSVARSTSTELAFGFFTIAIAAPVFEELLFRGYFWSVYERWAPQIVPFLLTSLGFALVHLSPLHVLGVLTVSAWLGWLRWQSGSVWPGVATHVANNALAVAGVVLAVGSGVSWVTVVVAVVTAAITLYLAVLARRWSTSDVVE